LTSTKAPDLSLEQELLELRAQIDVAIRSSALLNRPTVPILKEAMEYSLFARAKRIRPILALQAGKLFGACQRSLIGVVISIEFLHTYSLIHDDLPCMDNADFRRGVETCHRKFGDDIATLAGDALLTFAWDSIIHQCQVAEIPDYIALEIVHILSSAVGADGMIAGQVLDLQAEGQDSTLAEIQRIHVYKTGKLFVASLMVGALLAGASDKDLENLKTYGQNFGLVFQITDDILDVTGSTEAMGKDPGIDSLNQKSTYPSILGLSESRRLAGQHMELGRSALASYLEPEAYFLRSLIGYLLTRTS
jgi:geranylgeranyl diphosphate synthase, type II